MPISYYVENYLFPKLVEKNIKKTEKELITEIQKKVDSTNLSSDAVYHLLQTTSDVYSKVINDSNLLTRIENYKKDLLLNHFDYIKKKCSIKNNKGLTELIKKFPGDVFFINSIPDPDNKKQGFIVNLRRIAEIKEEQIVTKIEPTQVFSCIAIAQLNPPYKQKMTQTIGAMFSDIGLPNCYEEKRDEIISSFSEEFMNE